MMQHFRQIYVSFLGSRLGIIQYMLMFMAARSVNRDRSELSLMVGFVVFNGTKEKHWKLKRC